MKIKAAVVYEPNTPFVIEELDLRPIEDDEILVKTVATGICGTDLHARANAYRVPLPAVFGHEGAGIVMEVGKNVKGFAPGDHVSTFISSCGECDNCRAGRPYVCRNFASMIFSGEFYGKESHLSKDGKTVSNFCGQSSFASHMIVKAQNAVKLDKSVDLKVACTMGCGVMTGCGTITNIFKPQIGSSIAIFGVGTVGLSALMAAEAVGCTQIVAIDKNQLSLDKAVEFGATAVVDTTKVEDLAAALREISPTGFDYTVDTSGSPELYSVAAMCLAPHGTFVPLAQVPTISVNGYFYVGKTANLQGVGYGAAAPHDYIPRMVKLYQNGKLPVNEIISTYKFEDIEKAVQDKAEGKIIKPVLVFE